MLDAKEVGTSQKIYRMIEQSLERTGESLPWTMESLTVYAVEGRGDIDYLKLINLDNRSFMEVFYMLAFNAMPAKEYIEFWDDDVETLPRNQFQQKFVQSFVQRPDFASRHVRLRNCTCINALDFSTKRLRFRERVYVHLQPLYMKLPCGMRSCLKKMLWKFLFT